MPTSQWIRSPGRMARSAGPNCPFVASLRTTSKNGLKRDIQPQVGAALPIEPFQISRGRRAGGDGRATVAFGDDATAQPHDLLEGGDLLVGQRRQPARDQRLGRLHPLGIAGRQVVDELFVQVVGQPAGRPLDGARVDADALRIALLDDFAQQRPLLSLELAAIRPVVEIVRVRARDVDALHARRAAVVKDEDLQDRTPGIHRDERRENGVGIVFLTQDDPHVEAGLAHGQRQDGVEPPAQVTVDECGPLTHGARAEA